MSVISAVQLVDSLHSKFTVNLWSNSQGGNIAAKLRILYFDTIDKLIRRRDGAENTGPKNATPNLFLVAFENYTATGD